MNLINPAGQLINLTVTGLYVNGDESQLALTTDRESGADVFVLDTYADCCSETWFADIIGVKQLLGARVASLEEIEMPDPEDDRSRQEVDRAYGIKITTDKGVCEIVYRNSSNGYYGGDAEAIWGRSVPHDWKQITADWRA